MLGQYSRKEKETVASPEILLCLGSSWTVRESKCPPSLADMVRAASAALRRPAPTIEFPPPRRNKTVLPFVHSWWQRTRTSWNLGRNERLDTANIITYSITAKPYSLWASSHGGFSIALYHHRSVIRAHLWDRTLAHKTFYPSCYQLVHFFSFEWQVT